MTPFIKVIRPAPSITVLWKGGPGSGNFGHEGRPGEVGGSGESGKLGKATEEKVSSIADSIEGASNHTKEEVKDALTVGFSSFSKPVISNVELDLIDRYVAGDTKVAGRELVSIIEKGEVLKEVDVYRYVGAVRELDRVTSFSLRKEWVERVAKDNDKIVQKLTLKQGDKALFVAHFNTNHAVEVEVLIPPLKNKSTLSIVIPEGKKK